MTRCERGITEVLQNSQWLHPLAAVCGMVDYQLLCLSEIGRPSSSLVAAMDTGTPISQQ